MESSKENTLKKDKGEHIRVSDLRITEGDIIKSLPILSRFRCWVFGGAFGMRDPDPASKMPKVLVVYFPPIWKRLYYKRIYKYIDSQKPNGEQQDE